INIKLMKSAGLHQARQMIQLVRAAGLDWMIGSMMEGPASVTAAAALAAAFHCRYVDLDAAYFLGHPQASGGLAYAGPTGLLPDESGLGVTFTSTSHQTGVEQ
ncbi:MAG: dipeptide epimerase, partial [Alicyclobacillus sp.]|nr:dipeptide epimerase [Alicyclobacillus sp.]